MPRKKEVTKSKKRRRHEEEDEDEEEREESRAVKKFFDLDAVEADSDEDEDDDDDDGEFKDFIDHGVDGDEIPDEDDDGERVRRPPLVARTHEDEWDDDVDALEKMVNERYGPAMAGDDEDNGTEANEVEHWPSVRDPKLWLVKCQPGHEREITASLIRKSLEKGSESQIISAIALDHLKGYIYVEAYKEVHVRQACTGMRNVLSRNITMVPFKEMHTILPRETRKEDVSKGDWVRLKRSSYKGDLAKVVDVDIRRSKVTVKVTPRLGELSLSEKMDGVDCMYKTVSLSSVATGDVRPSFEEVQNFQEIGEADEDLATVFRGKDKISWVRGDAVVVVKGELKNMRGLVEYVEDDIAHIRPHVRLPQKTVAVHKSELTKYFEPGSHVKVTSGIKEGATGMVVKVNQDKVVILSDGSTDHITVFSEQITESTERADTRSAVERGNTNHQNRNQKVSTSRYPPHAATPAKLPPSRVGRVQSGRRHDSLIGSNVKILRGPYRGYRGRIKGLNGQNVRVELEAQMKIVTVDRSHISESSVSSTISMPHEKTPLHPPQTPFHSMGGETPWRTPLRTPTHPATPPHFSGSNLPWQTPTRDTTRPSTPVHKGSEATTSSWDYWNPGLLTSPSRLVSTP